MTNFKLTIQYDGGRYNGWQRLGNTDNTIQGKIERVLTEMAGHAVEIHGAGRTDAGVHAAAQVASFKLNTALSPDEIPEYTQPQSVFLQRECDRELFMQFSPFIGSYIAKRASHDGYEQYLSRISHEPMAI